MKCTQFILLLSFLLNISQNLAFQIRTKYDSVYLCSKLETCQPTLNEEILKMLDTYRDTTEDACKEFYMYANQGNSGQKKEQHHYPKILENRFLNSVLYLLDNDTLAFHHEAATEIKTLFKAIDDKYLGECYKNYEKEQPTLKQLDEVTIFKWSEAFENKEWQLDKMIALGELRQLGLNNVFFKERITTAYNDSKMLVIELSMPIEAKPFQHFEFYLNKYYNASKWWQIGMLKKLETDIEAVRKQHFVDINLGEKVDTELMTLTEFQQRFPGMNWFAYFMALYARPIVTDSLKLQLKNSAYFKSLDDLLSKTADKLCVVYAVIKFIDQNMRLVHYDYGVDVLSEATTFQCGLQARKNYEILLNYLHWRYVQPDVEETTAILQQIFDELKAQFSKNVERMALKLNASEHELVSKKLDGMKLRIGNTPLDWPAQYYIDFYKGLEFSNVSIWISAQNAKRLSIKNQHERPDVDYFYSFDDSLEQRFEPYYVPQRNIIVIPQPFLAMPYYSRHMDKDFLHATAGFGIARAIMAAFAPEGIIFDAKGVETEIGLDIIRKQEYQRGLNCLRRAEDKDKMAVIDITGLQLLIDTYFEQISSDKRESFFLYFAQYFSGRINWMGYFVGTDEYENRLLTILKYSKEFADVFHCENLNSCHFWS